MESLKSLAQIAEPDERNLYYIVTESGGKARRLQLDDIYYHVESIKLHEGVPEEIRNHFEQARNLALYSWFHYPFNVTSQFMGFVSVEYALKKKTGKRSSFKHLIKEAVDNRWITDEGFTSAKHRDGNSDKSYVETLIEVMPKLRNELAHGTDMLHNSAISSLLICAEFINQIFEINS